MNCNHSKNYLINVALCFYVCKNLSIFGAFSLLKLMREGLIPDPD